MTRYQESLDCPRTTRVEVSPDEAGQGLAGLVLVVVDVLRQLLERQTIRRMEAGSLTAEEIEQVGRGLRSLEEEVRQLAEDCRNRRPSTAGAASHLPQTNETERETAFPWR